MRTEEIVRLTPHRIVAIIKARQEAAAIPLADHNGPERRRSPRWPFKGAVEIWPDGGDGSVVTHATCLNISETGMGLSSDEHIAPGQTVEVAIHLPEATLCGRAAVRYCAQVRDQFMVGMEFLF
jgi:hypothetical protein